jgi:single-strand DNA-binding protein
MESKSQKCGFVYSRFLLPKNIFYGGFIMTTITTIGRITRDLELKTGEKSGCVYTNFSLAVNEGFGDSQKTMFFDCVAFGPDAERLIKAKAQKGSMIQVTGKFGTTEFT